MILPRFLGIGAMKAGSSTLHARLATHPGVALALGRKEVMFFDRHWDRGLDWYAAHFAHAGDRIPGEITPNYLFDPDVPARVAATLPGVRLVAILRDPVDRAVSQYRFFVKETAYRGTFEAFLAAHPNAVDRGDYAAQLARWTDHVDRAQLLVLSFEAYTGEPQASTAAVLAHLGADPAVALPDPDVVANRTRAPRFPRAYAAGRRALRWAYDHDLGPLVQAVKRTGLKRVLLSDDAPDAPVPDAARARLRARYAADTEALRPWLGDAVVDRWLSAP